MKKNCWKYLNITHVRNRNEKKTAQSENVIQKLVLIHVQGLKVSFVRSFNFIYVMNHVVVDGLSNTKLLKIKNQRFKLETLFSVYQFSIKMIWSTKQKVFKSISRNYCNTLSRRSKLRFYCMIRNMRGWRGGEGVCWNIHRANCIRAEIEYKLPKAKWWPYSLYVEHMNWWRMKI